MNKRCMVKAGAMNMMVALAIAAMMIVALSLLTTAEETKYSVGEKIKVDLVEEKEYTIIIKTPTK